VCRVRWSVAAWCGVVSKMGDVEESRSETEYKLYTRRWFVLAGYSLTIFAWNMSGARQLAVVPSYAKFFNTTNELSSDIGVDAISITNSVSLLVTYIFGAYAVDRWGLVMLVLGAGMVCVSNWIWFFAGESLPLVIVSQVLACTLGGCVTSSLMAVSNRWFGAKERSKATAIGSLLAVLGSGGALLISPFFATQADEIVDFTLKSCIVEAVDPSIVELYNAHLANGTELLCINDALEARDSFCCFLPLDIEALNLFMAIFPTVTFAFTLLAVRSLPPTPPSVAAEKKGHASVREALSLLYRTERFIKVSLSDLIVSGPPLVLLNSISRVFPSLVAEYSFLASAAGIALGIPASMIAAHYLDKTKAYWTFSMVGYASGTLIWIASTAAFAAGTELGAYFMLGLVVLAIVAYISWQTSIFELKLEYVFRNDISLEGWVVGTDRIVINLSTIIFVSLIPPERVGGGLNTFIYGAIIMVIGCIPTATIKKKYRYKRSLFEIGYHTSQKLSISDGSEPEDEPETAELTTDSPHQSVDRKASIPDVAADSNESAAASDEVVERKASNSGVATDSKVTMPSID